MAKLNLLYLASNGRSGSTIFEMLLNVSPYFRTVGEFHVLPWELRTNNKTCGCGTQVSQCPIWGPVVAQHERVLLDGSVGRFRLTYYTDRAIRWREVPSLLTGRIGVGKSRRKSIETYGAENEQVLRSFLETAAPSAVRDQTWIVDSSKSPYRLMWLAASQRFNLRVIHLVKDPRSFAYSMSKQLSGFQRAYRVGRFALRWQIENRLIDSVLSNHLPKEHWRRVRYEDFASDPERIFSDLCTWLNLPHHNVNCDALRSENHGISGNPSRFATGGIELDQKWIKGLSPSLQRLALFAGAGLARRYNYTSNYVDNQSE